MSASALQSLHLLERIYAQEAIVPPAPKKQVMMWLGTSLSVAGITLLVGEGEIDEIIETPDFTPIPGTKSWVMGVATHKGGLLPIYSGDAFFRKTPYTGRVREYCMVIRRPGFKFGLTLSAIERDMKLPIEERDMSCEIDKDFAELTLGGFRVNDQVLAVLDIDKLVTDADFVNASVKENDSTEEESNE
ncbi:MAG: chemotaxis protein CheW [Halioglobus sp.]